MAKIFTQQEFNDRFSAAIHACPYVQHPIYNVFNTFNSGRYYWDREAEFIYKYKVFYTIAKVLEPNHMVELGVCAGSSGHAYMSGAPTASFTGYDIFGTHDETVWNPLGLAHKALAAVSPNFKLIKANFRDLTSLPKADLVIVDGEHDYHNCYQDLLLAFTADPEYIWVDDYSGNAVATAVGDAGLVKCYEWWQRIHYCDAGMIIKMR